MINKEFLIKKIGHLRPLIIKNGEDVDIVSFNNSYFQYTNWSYNYRRTMFDFSEGLIRFNGFVSGQGKFLYTKGLLIDAVSSDILTITVHDDSGEMFYLLSNILDTPKCHIRHKYFRSHWRKGLFHHLERSDIEIKIIKVNHLFLQKFKGRLNKVPTEKDMHLLKMSIFKEVQRETYRL